MSYGKHNLYWGIYKADIKENYVELDSLQWIVRRQAESNYFADEPKSYGEICLILEDKNKSFWPVMSFLEKDEVKRLIKELQRYV